MKLVIYRRLSKVKEGSVEKNNQHGFDSQELDIQRYLAYLDNNGTEYEIIGEFGEFFSGRGDFRKRPEFSKALDMCKDQEATLVVTKPDRLARDVESGAHLLKQYQIVFTNYPDADTLTKHVLLTVAQAESDNTSERVKAALEVAKSKGIKIGAASEKYNRVKRDTHNKQVREDAKQHAEKYRHILETYVSLGLSLRKMAENLNERNIPTPKNGKWYAKSISNMLNYLNIER